MNKPIFDESAWRSVCEQSANIAIQGTGLSETLFAKNLFSLIQNKLRNISEIHHLNALTIAKEFGNLNAEELEEDDEWNSKNGYCGHGIEMGYCPAGCDCYEE